MDAGNELFEQVATLTGLPQDVIRKELHVMMEKKGINPMSLTLEQLRKVMADYLREVLCSAIESAGPTET